MKNQKEKIILTKMAKNLMRLCKKKNPPKSNSIVKNNKIIRKRIIDNQDKNKTIKRSIRTKDNTTKKSNISRRNNIMRIKNMRTK